MSKRSAHHHLAVKLPAQGVNQVIGAGEGAEGGVQRTIGGEAGNIGITLAAHVEVAANHYPAAPTESNRRSVRPQGAKLSTALIHDNGNKVGGQAVGRTKGRSEERRVGKESR